MQAIMRLAKPSLLYGQFTGDKHELGGESNESACKQAQVQAVTVSIHRLVYLFLKGLRNVSQFLCLQNIIALIDLTVKIKQVPHRALLALRLPEAAEVHPE